MPRVTVEIETPWAETLEAAAGLRGVSLEALAAAVLRGFAEAESQRQRGDAAAAAATDEAAPAEGLLLAEEPRPPYRAGRDDPTGTGQ